MFDDLIEANRRYADGYVDLGLRGTAAKGLAVLTCIDSRIDPLHMLGLEPGDAKILRNAGARVTDDVVRSLVLAVNLLDVDRVCIVQHTDCAVVGSDNQRLVELVAASAGQDVSGWDFLASPDRRALLRDDIDAIRACSLLPPSLTVGGFVLDVHTGELAQVDLH